MTWEEEEKEKIRAGLACCRQDPPVCELCPYADDGWDCSSKLMDEAIERLEELYVGAAVA